MKLYKISWSIFLVFLHFCWIHFPRVLFINFCWFHSVAKEVSVAWYERMIALGNFLCIPTPNTDQLNPLFHIFGEFRPIVNRVVARQSIDWLAANAQFSPLMMCFRLYVQNHLILQNLMEPISYNSQSSRCPMCKLQHTAFIFKRKFYVSAATKIIRNEMKRHLNLLTNLLMIMIFFQKVVLVFTVKYSVTSTEGMPPLLQKYKIGFYFFWKENYHFLRKLRILIWHPPRHYLYFIVRVTYGLDVIGQKNMTSVFSHPESRVILQ